jgi:hypothetical protein
MRENERKKKYDPSGGWTDGRKGVLAAACLLLVAYEIIEELDEITLRTPTGTG